ncbi:MAG TPA: acetyl-CoA carboxylase carboxyltransferase subunit alpha [Polyangia bacterium]
MSSASADAPVLDFERPLVELERRIDDLRALAEHSPDLQRAVAELQSRVTELATELCAHLTPWQTVLLSRHAGRPHTLDYVTRLVSDFVEVHGDRQFGDDPAVVGGFGWLGATPVVCIGHQKGRSTKDKVARNFGQPRPEGFRKARRLMELAGRFGRPVITFIDTPGAYPGVDAEERGQAEAIAKSLEVMAALPVPVVCVVIGEGGSGGALALGVGDRILMLEHAVYSVISPEGCASILWRADAKNESRKAEAAAAMKMTAPDLLRLGVIDEIVPEAPGGAHRNFDLTAGHVAAAIGRSLAELAGVPVARLLDLRYQKFRHMGGFVETNPAR